MDKQQLWDDFLVRWPIEKLKNLTLAEYVSVNDKDTFTYWLESKTKPLGSIQGNTSIKFGIYKRDEGAEPKPQAHITHGEEYSWQNRYGANEQDAFDHVLEMIVEIAIAAQAGNLKIIDGIKCYPLVKWKIAFLYQNQQQPSLVNIFSKPALDALIASQEKLPFSSIYQRLITDKGEQPLLAYGSQIWQKASQIMQKNSNEEIVKHFMHKPAFERNYKNWSEEVLTSFCELMRFANKNSLDIFTVDMDSGAAIRIGRKGHDHQIAREVFATFEPCQNKINFAQRYQHKGNYLSGELINETFEQLRKAGDFQKFNEENPISRKPHWPADYQADLTPQPLPTDAIAEPEEEYQMKAATPLNQILYGPPGTGKTYHTIEAAVMAAEPNFVWHDDREILKEEYDKLVLAQRIRFVTFHQSYGYEEFVEGLKARETDAGDVTYVTESGVFKSICDDASVVEVDADSGINLEGRVWKLSIEGTKANPAKTHCLENGIAAIGWGNTGDLANAKRNDYFNSQGKNNQNSLTYFSQDMAEGDIVLCIDSNTSVEALGVVTGEYKYQEDGLPTRQDYCHQIPIKWLAKGFSVGFKELNGNKQFNLPTCYPLSRLSVSDALKHLAEHDVTITTTQPETNHDNYVLVIDEINRGNISKIFGELITLIEPSKRSGGENIEALTLTLPHSGKPFSVPDNLYLIGTMNTADRSLALMDTALRRRFDFIEMMPNYAALGTKPLVIGEIEISISALLKTMNERIEVLYDREHTLGHAFFIPVKEHIEAGMHQTAFNELVLIFKNKIIPLLEEYFFEDWNKIRLILGDNRKKSKALEHYILINETTFSYDEIFGTGHGLDTYEQKKTTYQVASFDDKPGQESVWSKPNSYLAIYNEKALLSAEVVDSSDEAEGQED